MQYQERLSPGLGTWILVLVAGVGTFLVGAPISITVGIVAGVIASLLIGFLLFSSSPKIEITQNYVRVGRAQIEREYVGIAEVFRGEQARIAAGPDLDGRAFMCFRGWIDPKIRLEITDPADPTPYWLASTRHPEEIAKILNEGKEEQLKLRQSVQEHSTQERSE